MLAGMGIQIFLKRRGGEYEILAKVKRIQRVPLLIADN
jgi:hypothetical protein